MDQEIDPETIRALCRKKKRTAKDEQLIDSMIAAIIKKRGDVYEPPEGWKPRLDKTRKRRRKKGF